MLNHLAIIMDGNRRWAKEKFLPSILGHKAGADNVKNITELVLKKGIKYLTIWALSSENLINRGKDELDGIISLINNIESYLNEMIKKGLKFETIGDISKLPKKSQEILKKVKEKTKNNSGITLIVALAYGGQDEIIRAVKEFVTKGGDINKLDSNNFRIFLDSGKFPNPDLIIRTGGDIRHSGFLLYNSAYSEYYYSKKKWPEFDEKELNKAIKYFNETNRNFGK